MPNHVEKYIAALKEFVKMNDKMQELLDKESKHIKAQLENQLYNLGIEINNTIELIADVYKDECSDVNIAEAEEIVEEVPTA